MKSLYDINDLLDIKSLTVANDSEYKKSMLIRKIKAEIQETIINNDVKNDLVVAKVTKNSLTEQDRLVFEELISDLKHPKLGYEVEDINGKEYLIKLPEFKGISDWEEYQIDGLNAGSFLPAWFIRFMLYLKNELESSEKRLIKEILDETVELLISNTNDKIKEAFLSKGLMKDEFVDNLSVTVDLKGTIENVIESNSDFEIGIETIAEQSGVFGRLFFALFDDFPKIFEWALKPSLVDRFNKTIKDGYSGKEYSIEGLKDDDIDRFAQTRLAIKRNINL